MLNDPNWDKKPEVELDEDGCLLEQAADYMEQYGWCQGNYEKGEAVCLAGAVLKVGEGRTRGYRDVWERIEEAVGNKCNITTWNDSICKTKEQAVNALRKAARLVK